MIPIPNGENYLIENMKEKRYHKSALRKTLERNMRERRHEPKLMVSPMEFSRWLKFFVEEFHLPSSLCQAKTLTSSLVDAFSSWLGYPLR